MPSGEGLGGDGLLAPRRARKWTALALLHSALLAASGGDVGGYGRDRVGYFKRLASPRVVGGAQRNYLPGPVRQTVLLDMCADLGLAGA